MAAGDEKVFVKAQDEQQMHQGNQRAGNPLAKRRAGKLVVACVAMLAIGFIYGWSVLSSPISAEFQWEPAALTFTFTLLMWTFCIGGFLGAKVCDRTNSHITLFLAAAIILVAFISTSLLARADAPWVLYLTYGLLGGLGDGMAYTVTMGAALAWFQDRAGTVSGVLLLCYGTSTMLLSSVAAWMFTLMDWRTAFFIIGIVMAAVLAVCGGVVLRRPTEDELDLLPKPVPKQDVASQERRSYTTLEMVRKPAFWSYFGWMVVACTIALGFTGHTNQLALAGGADPVLAVALVGAYSVVNGLGRLGFGFVYDALGTTKTMLVVAIVHGVSAALLACGLIMGSVPLTAFALVFAGASIAGTPVTGSGFMATAFGPDHYAQNLSVLNLALIPSALIGPMIISFSLSLSGAYVPGLLTGIALAFVAIALALLTKRLLKQTS